MSLTFWDHSGSQALSGISPDIQESHDYGLCGPSYARVGRGGTPLREGRARRNPPTEVGRDRPPFCGGRAFE